ncbi:MAG TPA: peptidylprolyl isomerase, partial [Phycisphaerae bacterium]|nr:peptidylprolyl isomerase [Phycisphaerae bacterium]
ALAEGQVAGPIETDSGFYLVKAYRIEGGKVTPFEQAQQDIEKTLRNRLYLDLTQKYFKDLLGKSLIVHSEKFLDLTLQKAAGIHYGGS